MHQLLGLGNDGLPDFNFALHANLGKINRLRNRMKRYNIFTLNGSLAETLKAPNRIRTASAAFFIIDDH